MDAPAQKLRHRNDLQGLRAVAVIVVVLAHARVRYFSGGFVGVDVFFVLSGYLITGLLLNEARETGRVSLGAFYVRRARRILPAAALTLVATEIAAYQLLNFVRAKSVLWDGLWAAFFAANVRFARVGTDYFARDQPPSPLQHFWTLAVEEQFYLVWPGILALILFGVVIRRSRRTGSLAVRPSTLVVGVTGLRRLLVAVSVALGASLAWSIVETSRHPTSAYFSTFTRAWELGLGAALAVGTVLAPALPAAARTVAGWLGVTAILAAAILYSAATAFPGYAALLPTVGAALVILAGAGGTPQLGVGRLLATPPMRYVGDRSYTLYLWHWPFLVIGAQYVGHDLSVVQRLGFVAAASAVSVVTYRFYENPIRRAEWSDQAILSIGTVAVAAAVVVAVFGITAIQTREAQSEPLPTSVADADATAAPLAPPSAASGARLDAPLPAVRRAVAAARRGLPIPTALQPPVGQLLGSEYQFPAGCAAGDGQTSSRLCRLGDARARRTIVLFGDSHAQMWMPALLQLAASEHWAVLPLDKSACSPPLWYRSGECHTWVTWALGRIASLAPDVVLVAGAYGNPDPAAATSIGRLTQALGHPKRHVVVIADVPRQAQQPVDCLLGRDADLGRCSTRIDGPIENPQVYDEASASGASVISTSGWFCADALCPMVVGDTIVYQDTGHVTSVYATQLVRPFAAAFDAAIAKR